MARHGPGGCDIVAAVPTSNPKCMTPKEPVVLYGRQLCETAGTNRAQFIVLIFSEKTFAMYYVPFYLIYLRACHDKAVYDILFTEITFKPKVLFKCKIMIRLT